MSIYIFTSDSCHGWLRVKRNELKSLGILEEISPFSYQNGNYVYLEEDVDMSIFINAKDSVGEHVDIKTRYANHSSIRSYSRFIATISDLIDIEGWNDTCTECQFYGEWTEYHPYGSTMAGEQMAECSCEENERCPRIKGDKQ